MTRRQLLVLVATILLSLTPALGAETHAETKRLLYVATPGVRNYLEYGGHGLLVFDIDDHHKFLKRIPTAGLADDGKPSNVKGVCANANTKRIYITTLQKLQCIDMLSGKLLWEKSYEGGCDRMSMTPDGKVIYLPSLEKDHWHVIDALSGDVITKIVPKSGAHNTIVGLDGSRAYLAGLKSPLLRVADARTHEIVKEVGPFSAPVRPFTVNGKQTIAFVNVNDLLGFEIGDLTTGRMLHRVEVPAEFKKGAVKRHGCPSHGVGLTPDESELWLTDAHNQRMHIYDATTMPPRYMQSIEVHDQPGWITFSLDGQYAYPSTGEVIDVKSKKVVATLKDETGARVQSEKMLEIQFAGTQPVRTGDQFGLGRAVEK